MKFETKCPVCQNKTVQITDILSSCAFCSHVFQTDMKATCMYNENYLETYISHNTCDIMSAARSGMILGSLSLGPQSKLLDIGYANGAFLKSISKLGYITYGIDLHGKDMGICEVSYNTPITYDLVSFFDSLEHFEDLTIPQQLNTRYAIVSLPMRPYFFPEKAHLWKHYKPGEHLHYFSIESLEIYMAKWGLKKRITHGNPEDIVRGRLTVDGVSYPNIYTAIYGR